LIGPLGEEPSEKVGASGKVITNDTTNSFSELGVSMQGTSVIFEGDI
jgi:hypothetical protein